MSGFLAIGVLAYLILLAINWRDREPSPAAIRLTTLFRERPAIADAQNGFVFAMGFNVPPGESPTAMGSERLAWLEASGSRLDLSQDPMEKVPDTPQRTPAIEAFLQACWPGRKTCDTAFDSGDEVYDQWISSEGWLLTRYRELISLSGWREPRRTWTAPLPRYGLVMDGQKLMLLHARRLARQGNTSEIHALLETDLRFWRMTLESSDTLISRMIATRALTRHFEWGNLLLRELPAGSAADAIPDNWRVPLSDAELSILRCMTGEWIFFFPGVSRPLRLSGRRRTLGARSHEDVSGGIVLPASGHHQPLG